MIEILTASWFSKLPEGYFRVSISRSAPRGQPGGWKAYKHFMPGAWFNNVSKQTYLDLYREEMLAKLDPAGVVADLAKLTKGAPAVLLCYEAPVAIQRGEKWCHRHLAATWLEQQLGITVAEVGFPNLERFAALHASGIPDPVYLKAV